MFLGRGAAAGHNWLVGWLFAAVLAARAAHPGVGYSLARSLE
jgi:hypothetical protein